MAFAMEWIKGQDLWETKAYGKYDAVSYVRKFLGDEVVYVAAKDVLFFETFPGCYRCNPFIKQAMDSFITIRLRSLHMMMGRWGILMNIFTS